MTTPVPSNLSPEAFNEKLNTLANSDFLIVEKNEKKEFVLSVTKKYLALIKEEWRDFRNNCSMRNNTLLEAATIAFLEENKHLINTDNLKNVEKLAKRVGYVAQGNKKNNAHEDLNDIISLIRNNTFKDAPSTHLEHFLQQKTEFTKKYVEITDDLGRNIPIPILKWLADADIETKRAKASLLSKERVTTTPLPTSDRMRTPGSNTSKTPPPLSTAQPAAAKPVSEAEKPAPRKPFIKSKEEIDERKIALKTALEDKDLSPGIRQAFDESLKQWNAIVVEVGSTLKLSEELIVAWTRDELLLEVKSLETIPPFFGEHLKGLENLGIDDAIQRCKNWGIEKEFSPGQHACAQAAALVLTECKKHIDDLKSQAKLTAPQDSPDMSGRQFVKEYVDWLQNTHDGRKMEKLDYEKVKEMFDVASKIPGVLTETKKEFTSIRESLEGVSPVILNIVGSMFKNPEEMSLAQRETLILTLKESLEGASPVVLDILASMFKDREEMDRAQREELILTLKQMSPVALDILASIFKDREEMSLVQQEKLILTLKQTSPVLLDMIASVYKDRGDIKPPQREELIFTLLSRNYPIKNVQKCLLTVLEDVQEIFAQKAEKEKEKFSQPGEKGKLLEELTQKRLEEMTSQELVKKLRSNKEKIQQWSPEERAIVKLASLLMSQSKQILVKHREELGKESFAKDSCQNLASMLDYVERSVALQEREVSIKERENAAEKRLNLVRGVVDSCKKTNPPLGRLLERRVAVWEESEQESAPGGVLSTQRVHVNLKTATREEIEKEVDNLMEEIFSHFQGDEVTARTVALLKFEKSKHPEVREAASRALESQDLMANEAKRLVETIKNELKQWPQEQRKLLEAFNKLEKVAVEGPRRIKETEAQFIKVNAKTPSDDIKLNAGILFGVQDWLTPKQQQQNEIAEKARLQKGKEATLSSEDMAFKKREANLVRLIERLEEREVRVDRQEQMFEQIEWMARLHMSRLDCEKRLRQKRHIPNLLSQSKDQIDDAIQKLTLLKTSMPVSGIFGMERIPIDQLELQDAELIRQGQPRLIDRDDTSLLPLRPGAKGHLSNPSPNTWAAYEALLHQAISIAHPLLPGNEVPSNISPNLRTPFAMMHQSLSRLVVVANENGALREGLGKWRGEDSADNRALDDFLADGVPMAMHDEQAFAYFTQFLELVEKGMINSKQLETDAEGHLNKDAKGNLVSPNKRLVPAYNEVLDVYKFLYKQISPKSTGDNSQENTKSSQEAL